MIIKATYVWYMMLSVRHMNGRFQLQGWVHEDVGWPRLSEFCTAVFCISSIEVHLLHKQLVAGANNRQTNGFLSGKQLATEDLRC